MKVLTTWSNEFGTWTHEHPEGVFDGPDGRQAMPLKEWLRAANEQRRTCRALGAAYTVSQRLIAPEPCAEHDALPPAP